MGPVMNVLSRDKQIEIIAALTEGVGIRATARLVGVDRETVGKLALQVGKGCAELHDRRFVGIRTGRLELDELWAFVGKKQKRTRAHEVQKGDQYTYVALASTSRAIVTYRTGKRDGLTTDDLSKTFASASWARLRSARTASSRTSNRSAMPSATAPMA
jgi:hypothetical protein